MVIFQFYVVSASCFPILLGITFGLWCNFHILPLMIVTLVADSAGRAGRPTDEHTALRGDYGVLN